MKNGFYIQPLIPFDPEISENNLFWYVIAVKNNQALYLHKEGGWFPSCYDYLRKEYKGHYATKEEAIKTLKFFTSTKIINGNEKI